MAVLATGQISIVDYNDAISLTGFITSNHPKTQIYNPDNEQFSPDWSSQNLTLTASLFKIGSSNDIIDSNDVRSIRWFDAASPSTPLTTGGSYVVNGKRLTVNKNILSGNRDAIDFICEVTYIDPSTGLELLHKMSISFGKVVNGGGITSAVAWLPNGNIFKNDSIDVLYAEADLWRGGVVDTTNVSYQWYKQDPSATQDEGGGVGWKKITSTYNHGEKGYTTRRLEVPSSAVPNFEVYKIVITDTDTSSPTYNQKFQDTVTFLDQSDPIQVSVVSTGGNVFKNGVGQSELTAQLFRAGEEIDIDGTKYTYKWYKYDKDGNMVTDFGGSTAFRLGKVITVTDNDVDVKATFIVEIE